MLISMNKEHEKLAMWGRSYLEIKKEYTILDLGCGGGRNIEYFLTKANKVYGIDHSPTSVNMASKINMQAIKDGRCQILVGDVRNIPFLDESIDIVTAFETIYFWNDIESCFKEIYRVLKKDVRRLLRIIDFEVYTPDDLINMLTKIGFESKKILPIYFERICVR